MPYIQFRLLSQFNNCAEGGERLFALPFDFHSLNFGLDIYEPVVFGGFTQGDSLSTVGIEHFEHKVDLALTDTGVDGSLLFEVAD